MIEVYSMGGINWTWYVRVARDGDTCTIEERGRLHNSRDLYHVNKLDSLSLGCAISIEDDSRNIIALDIYGGKAVPQRLLVRNPARDYPALAEEA